MYKKSILNLVFYFNFEDRKKKLNKKYNRKIAGNS